VSSPDFSPERLGEAVVGFSLAGFEAVLVEMLLNAHINQFHILVLIKLLAKMVPIPRKETG